MLSLEPFSVTSARIRKIFETSAHFYISPCEMHEIPIIGTSFLEEDAQSYPGTIFKITLYEFLKNPIISITLISSSSMPTRVWTWLCCPANASYHLRQWRICKRVSSFVDKSTDIVLQFWYSIRLPSDGYLSFIKIHNFACLPIMTPFLMNPSSPRHSSVNQQEQWSLPSLARSRFSLQLARWLLELSPSLRESEELQAS